MNEDARSDTYRRNLAYSVVLVVGGTLMLIGSLEPWTYGGLYFGVAIHRNGLQLGNNGGFSPAAIPTIASGSVALATGALVLANRGVPRILRFPATLLGFIGVATGLYGLGEARWYTKQMTTGYPGIFYAGADVGIWLVLIGGIAVLVAGALRELVPRWLSILVAAVTASTTIVGALLLAPRLS